MTTPQSPASTEPSGGDIVARASRDYRNRRYLMALILVGLGPWFAYDGWVKWPAGNRKIVQLQSELTAAQKEKDDVKAGALSAELKKYTHHNSAAILLQKILAITLPPLGIGFLCWMLYHSRGEYRLSGRTLHVPGHPPVTFDQITRIDKRLWDRKGIAYVDYEAPGHPARRIKLDDFVYDRKPTDQIYQRIEKEIAPAPDAQPDAGHAA